MILKGFINSLTLISIGIFFYYTSWQRFQIYKNFYPLNDMSPLFFAILGSLFIIFGTIHSIYFFLIPLLTSFIPKPKCFICKKESADLYMLNGVKFAYFCRPHLIEEFAREVNKSPFNFAIVEFQPEANSATGKNFFYIPLSKAEKLGWKNEEKEAIKKMLTEIEQKRCKICNNNGCILFIPKSSAPYSKYGPKALEEFIEFGMVYCKEHGLKKIIPTLESNKKKYDEGFYSPYSDSGFYTTTEI